MIVYKTTNLINGKIYIGKDSNNNPRYLGSGIILQRAIKKYGKHNFRKETLEVCSQSNINEREIYWIAKFNSTNKRIGYNKTLGGDGFHKGHKVSKTTRLKLANAARGKIISESTRFKISQTKLGTKFTQDHKDKLSESHLGERNYLYGKKLSKELVEKMKAGKRLKILQRQAEQYTP